MVTKAEERTFCDICGGYSAEWKCEICKKDLCYKHRWKVDILKIEDRDNPHRIFKSEHHHHIICKDCIPKIEAVFKK